MLWLHNQAARHGESDAMFSLPEKVYRGKLLKINGEKINTSVDYTFNRCSQQFPRRFCTLARRKNRNISRQCANRRNMVAKKAFLLVLCAGVRRRTEWKNSSVLWFFHSRYQRDSPLSVFLSGNTVVSTFSNAPPPATVRKTVSQETWLLFSQRLLNVPDHKIKRRTRRHRSYYNPSAILFGIFFFARFSRKLETIPSINIYIAAHATDTRANFVLLRT